VQNKIIDAEFEAISVAMNALEDAIDKKSDTSHAHDDKYYTESEIDTKLASKSDTTHKHDDLYDAKGAAAAVQKNLNAVSDTLGGHTGNANIHVTTDNKTNWNAAYTHSQAAHARVDATKVADSATNGNILINGTETNVYSHPNSGVTAGTYKSVTVNAQGHVTAGSNPTTLAGYGITDAVKTRSNAEVSKLTIFAGSPDQAVFEEGSSDYSGIILKTSYQTANYCFDQGRFTGTQKVATLNDIPVVSSFITKDVNNLTNYETKTTAEGKYALKSDISNVYK
jgi:phage-related tail fiber protein